MNRFVESAETLNWLLNASLQAALLVPVILLAQWLLRRRLSARWRFALWWLLILRLLLPVSFASPWSIFNYVQPNVNLAGSQFSLPAAANEAPVAATAVGAAVPVRLADNDSPPITDNVPAETPQAVQGVELSPATPLVASEPAEPARPAPWSREFDVGNFLIPLIWAAWLLVALTLMAAVTFQSIAFSRRLRSARQHTPAPLHDLLAECRRIMGIRREVVLLETEAVTSPVLYGLFRHRILLPWGFADRFSPAELRHVLLHELAHVQRGDLWLNWLVTALQIVHWFNPLVWLGFARLRADRELACDELAMLRSGADTGRDYGRTMLKLLEDFARPKAMPGLVGILEDKQQMRRRVRMIARFKRPSRWSALALVPIAALGLVLLTDAQVRDPKSADATVQNTNNESPADDALETQAESLLFWPDELAVSLLGPVEEQAKAWTGHMLEGLRLACLPDRSRYALGDEITLRCTITNTSDREHRINWHPTAGSYFKLRKDDRPEAAASTASSQSAPHLPQWTRRYRGGELPHFKPVGMLPPVRIEPKPSSPSSEIILPPRTSVELVHRRPAKQTGKFHWILAYEAFMPAVVTQETMELLDRHTLLSDPFTYEVTESGGGTGTPANDQAGRTSSTDPPKPIFEMRLVESYASGDTEALRNPVKTTKPLPESLQNLFVRKEPLLDVSALFSAQAGTDQFTGRPVINLEFTAQGQARFAEVTRAHVGRQLAIVVDGQVLSAPHINEPITVGKAVISGSFTREEAERLARFIQQNIARNSAGSTPFTGAIQGRVFLGRVILEGKPPPEMENAVMDEHSRAQHTNAPTTQFSVVADDDGLKDVVVYLEGDLPPLAAGTDLPPLIIDHQSGFKVPYVSALAVGQTLLLTNSDAQLHNCHIIPPQGSTNREVNKTMKHGVASSHTFTAPDQWVRLKCDVQPWEFAYVCVFPHRYFAVTDATGRFSITNVPPGRYQLHTLHRKAKGLEPVEVEITSPAVSTLGLHLYSEAALQLVCHPDQSHYAIGDEITLRCTITNISDEEQRVTWHPTTGSHLTLGKDERAWWLDGRELLYFKPVDVRPPVRIEPGPGSPLSEIILPPRTSVELVHQRTANIAGSFRWILAYEAFQPAVITQETLELLDRETIFSNPFTYEVTEGVVEKEGQAAQPSANHSVEEP